MSVSDCGGEREAIISLSDGLVLSPPLDDGGREVGGGAGEGEGKVREPLY